MTPWPVRKIIRTMLRYTSVAAATRQIETERDRTLAIVTGVPEELVAKEITVPSMPGVDEDMRAWSLGQILEHNTIVNRVFTQIVDHLLRGETFRRTGDPKRDVMPCDGSGAEQIAPFQESVVHHLDRLRDVSSADLAATAKHPHPIFGEFTAKHWHAMFGFHLRIHRRQAEAVAKQLDTFSG